MKRRKAFLAGGATIAVLAAFGGSAWAYFSVDKTSGVTARGGVLRAPERLQTESVAQEPGNGAVRLTWSLARPAIGEVEPGRYVIERQLLSETKWTELQLTPHCGADDGAPTRCTAIDESAQFNATYRYQVTSRVGKHWASGPTSARLAASLRPTTARVGQEHYALNSVAALDANRLVAVGSGGAIRVCTQECATDQALWVAVHSPVTVDLRQITMVGADDAWAIGDGGTILHCTDRCATPSATWTPQTLPGGPDLHGVLAFGNPSYVAVVGAGELWFSEEHGESKETRTWTRGLSVPGTTLHGIAGTSPQQVVVVGAKGAAGYVAGCAALSGTVCGEGDGSFTAGAWAPPSGTPRAVAAVAGRYLAVGTHGVIATATQGSDTWNAVESGVTSDLTAVAANPAGPANMLAAGAPGTLVSCTITSSVSCTSKKSTPGHPVRGLATLADTTGETDKKNPATAQYWAAGADSDDTTPKMSHLRSSWESQELPPKADARDLANVDMKSVAVPTAGSGAPAPRSCGTASLRATLPVPKRSNNATAAISVQFIGTFPNNPGLDPASAWLLGSLDSGATWSGANLGTLNGAGPLSVTGKVLPGLTLSTSEASNLTLCLVGASAGGTMAVDLLHIDVTEQ
ncbi:MAG: hypothetical protein JXA67_12040 [Micromonosporaceae bacterium]|nr:hypothetical protein [Micromonosporaceae bacterium]